MADAFVGAGDIVSGPARRVVVVVPHDANDLVDIPKGVYVGTGGDLTMIGVDAPANASGVTWKNVPAGALIPFRPRRILSTGTSAANMLALY